MRCLAFPLFFVRCSLLAMLRAHLLPSHVPSPIASRVYATCRPDSWRARSRPDCHIPSRRLIVTELDAVLIAVEPVAATCRLGSWCARYPPIAEDLDAVS